MRALVRAFVSLSVFASLACAVEVTPLTPTVTVQASPAQVYVPSAPPAVLYSAPPAPRPGYLWINGYWSWSGSRWVWIDGHWEARRAGYVWIAPHHEVRGGRHVYVAGRWEREAAYKSSAARPRPAPSYRGAKQHKHHK